MSSLSFPDLNVWLALATPEHVHAQLSGAGGNNRKESLPSRLTQLGFLRLVTTAAAMDGKPLTPAQAWRVHDRWCEDERVSFVAEPPEVEKRFREEARGTTVSPKVWADAWLLASAEAAGGRLVTFDRALRRRGSVCLLEK